MADQWFRDTSGPKARPARMALPSDSRPIESENFVDSRGGAFRSSRESALPYFGHSRAAGERQANPQKIAVSGSAVSKKSRRDPAEADRYPLRHWQDPARKERPYQRRVGPGRLPPHWCEGEDFWSRLAADALPPQASGRRRRGQCTSQRVRAAWRHKLRAWRSAKTSLPCFLLAIKPVRLT